MKQFLSWIPYQGRGDLKAVKYEAADNPKLEMGRETRFPIISVMNGYLEEGEEFEVIVVVADYQRALDNLAHLKFEVEALCTEKKVSCREWKVVKVPYDDTVGSQLKAFSDITEVIEEEGDLYSCISFGSKPSAVVEVMLLRYARMLKNCSNECVVYGKFDFEAQKGYIYDITSLLYLDDVMRVLAENHILDPEEIMKFMISEQED